MLTHISGKSSGSSMCGDGMRGMAGEGDDMDVDSVKRVEHHHSFSCTLFSKLREQQMKH
jgi:hypothetical protein